MSKTTSRVRARAGQREGIQSEHAVSAGICLVLVALVWIVFGQTLGHQFVNYDDDDYVYENPVINRGLTADSLRWAFTHVHAHNWHPLTTLSHMLDCQLFGVQPWGPHLTNIVLQAVAAVLLFLALRSLSGALWRSAFVALLFAVHPLRAESVAWISERKDVLSGVFFMLTLWCYCRFAVHERRSPGQYLATLFFFGAGLMCKPTLVTVPFVLLLLDYWPLRRFSSVGGRRLILEKVPFFVLTVASCVATLIAQQGALENGGRLELGRRIGNSAVSYVAYLGKTFFPMHLAVFYPYPAGDSGVVQAIFSFLLLLGITVFVVIAHRGRPFLLTGWLWFLGMLIPMIGLLQVGLQARADRYTYLPQIGLFIAVTWGAVDLLGRLRHGRVVGAVAGVLSTATLSALAYNEVSYWRDSEALWSHAVENTGDNFVAQNSLGRTLLEKGELEQAARHFQAAAQLDPGSALVHSNLGKTLERERRIDEAMAEFQKALKLRPNDAGSFYDVGNALMEEGQPDQAIGYFERAIQRQPDLAGAYNNLGNAQRRLGRLEQAVLNYRRAIAIRPDLPDPRYNLGNALWTQGNRDEAIGCLEAALQLRPRSAAIHNSLGFALAAVGKTDEALEHLEESLRLDPSKPETHRNLANVLARMGRRDEAVVQLRELLRLRPGDEETIQQLQGLGR